MSSGAASQHATEQVLARELALAEERGAERVRARLRDMLVDSRRVVRLGGSQIEVVEVAAIEDVLGPEA